MNLHILFGQRKQSYAGEYAPEVLVCWTESDVEENPEGFDQAVLEAVEKAKSDFSATRVLIVSVNAQKITRLLNESPVIEGTVEDP